MKPVILGLLLAALGLGAAVAVGNRSPQAAIHGTLQNTVVGGVNPETPHGTLPDSDHN